MTTFTARSSNKPRVPDGQSLSGFVRIMTHRRIFTEPTSPERAWEAVDALLAAPAGHGASPG